MNLRNQLKRRMEKIKPEIPLKRSMTGKKIYVYVCVCVLFKEFLRAMERLFSPENRKVGKYYQCNSFFRTQKYLFKSCVYKLMHIHKMIHLVGTYSHPEAVKKLQL